jgi:effector-binding domain-containing protein
MTTTFELRDMPARKVLAIRESCTMTEIGPTVGRVLSEVHGWAKAHDVPIAGPAFTRYLEWGNGKCVVEAGFVVDRDVPSNDARVVVGELEAGPAVFGLHVGPYEKLAATYGAMDQWIKAHGLKPASTMWECYLDPATVRPDEQRTELWWPVESTSRTAPAH